VVQAQRQDAQRVLDEEVSKIEDSGATARLGKDLHRDAATVYPAAKD